MAKYNFMGKRKIFLTLSAIVVLASIVLLLIRSLNLGLDFTGGVLLERKFEKPVTAAQIRGVLTGAELKELGLGQSVIQPAGDGSEAIIRTKSLSDQEIRKIDAALGEKFGKVQELRTDMVEPVIGKELMRQAGWAVAISWLLILVYIAFRFEYLFGIAGVLALVHDVIVTLGFFALIGWELNMTFVAAMLTIVGYSINNTIVIFDRIRENMRLRRRESLEELVNNSINETLSRTINTSLTTLFTVVAILVFGGATLKVFALALLVGIVAGGWSSLFMASPIWFWLKGFEERKRASGKAVKA
ncbi:MAG: protein translocase subunit SecF [Firmicutes bacterium]|jgi:preprotein translocase subunit SecF|nr:protein translocase subunit SecF [Bacillota bacterium]HQD39008.1 protein translocase subunit SecF [Bacillota bacterium]